jgi:formamidopyrimidine-DNA glycosylase
MPEMPEVETVVRSLRRHLPGRRIRRAQVSDDKLADLDTKLLAGRTILGVERAGKLIVIDLSTTRRPLWLCVHLRMTGRLLFTDGALPLNEAHRRFTATLDRGAIHFYDTRRFGRIHLVFEAAGFAPPGIEILSPEFTPARLAELIGSGRGPLKPWLLRQDRIVGFGNIYASEVCFAAGLDPRRSIATLSPAEIKTLHHHTVRIFAKAIEHGGTTFQDFMDCEGKSGNYRRFLKVYGREGEQCKRRGCSGQVQRVVQAGRSTFFCPTCQR